MQIAYLRRFNMIRKSLSRTKGKRSRSTGHLERKDGKENIQEIPVEDEETIAKGP
jgi:hypothetical protein